MITFRRMGRLGRLGNALFQIAATIGIADRYEQDVVFPADWMHRKYFSIPDKLFSEHIPPNAIEATEYIHHMDSRAAEYMQDVNLFEHSLPKLREYFKPSPLALQTLELFQMPNRLGGKRIAVHVRRGDKITDPGVANIYDYFIQPGVEYYKAGINKLFRQGDSICLFSDDIEWVKEHIVAEFYGTGDAYWKDWEPQFGSTEPLDWIDFFLMAKCDAFVISGSTMGIWAALLADVNPHLVIRPDVVYGPMLAYVNSELLFPPDWRIAKCF